MTVKDVLNCIHDFAPDSYQESYDNSGLLVGDENNEVSGVLCTLDCTEDVVQEAITKKCNVIAAHHPIIFGKLKRLTGKNYIERTVIKAIKNDIAIIAAHTNLDNVKGGVNRIISEKIGLKNTQILAPKGELLEKITVFCPTAQSGDVKTAMFRAGAGEIGEYDSCSFNLVGKGTFRAGENTDPFVGEKGEIHTEEEERIEVVVERHKADKVISKMVQAHPYEEVAYDRYPLLNKYDRVGSGMIGELESALPAEEFLKVLKEKMKTECIRHTKPVSSAVKTIAVCGGAGSFLLGNAIARKADVFITGDFKYHQFFDADEKIMIADIGHYESEQFTAELLSSVLQEKFSTFAIRISEVNTNPISYK